MKKKVKKPVRVQEIKRTRGKIAGTTQMYITIPRSVAKKANIKKGSRLIITANGTLKLSKRRT